MFMEKSERMAQFMNKVSDFAFGLNRANKDLLFSAKTTDSRCTPWKKHGLFYAITLSTSLHEFALALKQNEVCGFLTNRTQSVPVVFMISGKEILDVVHGFLHL